MRRKNDQFEQVQGRPRSDLSSSLQQRRRHTPRLLSGLLVCAVHKGPYAVTTTHRPYYQCRLRNRRGKKACDNAALDPRVVEPAVLGNLARQLMTPANLNEIVRLVCDEVAAQQERINDSLLELSQREARLNRSVGNLVQAITDGTPASVVNPTISAIKDEVDQLSSQKARLQENRPKRTISVTKDDILDALEEIDRLVSDAEPEEAARFASSLIDKIVVDGDTLTVHYAFSEPEEPELVAQLWLPGHAFVTTDGHPQVQVYVEQVGGSTLAWRRLMQLLLSPAPCKSDGLPGDCGQEDGGDGDA